MTRRIIIISSIVFALSISILFIKHRRESGTLSLYKQLRIGLDKSQVQTLFGDSSDYICQYKDYDIWYYSDNGFATQVFPHHKFASHYTFTDVDKLPDTFGYITVAFNHEGKLHAYTWIGETYTVEYDGGSIEGTHFRQIPTSNF